MNFSNSIIYGQEEREYKRMLRAQDFLAKAQEKMEKEGAFTVTMELEDTSDSFYRLLGSMDVTGGLFVVTRPWFGLCKSKVRVTSTAVVGSNVPMFSHMSEVDQIFKY